MEPKKVLFISKDSNWQLYRNEVLTKLAVEFNLNVEILTTGELKNHLKENQQLKYRFFRNFFGQSAKFSFFPGAIRYLIRHKPDVVLALNNTTQLTEYLALLVCKIYKIKFVLWTHGFNHYQLKNQFLQKIKKMYAMFFLKLADAIIVFSPAGKEYLVENDISAAKVFIASNTLDTDKLRLLRKRMSADFDRQKFLQTKFPGMLSSDKTVVLLFSGRLNKEKKVENAIETVRNLKNKGYDARLLVVGDGAEKESLMNLASKLAVKDIVYFGGSIFNDELVTPYFLASDIFLMPGYIGLAIVHAFAFDLPVITEDLKIHSPEIQYLKPGINGCLVKEDDIEEASEAIIKITCSKRYQASLREGARESFNNEANIHLMLENMNTALF